MDSAVTAEMVVAGHEAEQTWHARGQSGPLAKAIYHAMHLAFGATPAEHEAENEHFHAGMLAAGNAACEAWVRQHTKQDGSFAPSTQRPVADMFTAMVAAR